MKVLVKLFKDVVCSRKKLLTLFIAITITAFLYTFSCKLLLSKNCQLNHDSINSMLLVKKSHPNISEIIPPGGTFYRSSFLNRTQVKQNVDKLVKELRMNRTTETKEQRLLHEKQQLKAEKLMDADLEDIELENWNLDNYYHMPQTPKRKNIISSPKQSTVPPILYHKTTKSFSQLRINSVESTISEEMSLELENELSESEHLEDTGPEDDNDEIELESNQESETQNIALTDNLSKKKPKIVFNNKGEIVKKILPSGEIDKKKVKKKKSQKVIPLLPDTFPYFETGYPPAKTDTHTCRDSLCSEYLTERDKAFYKYCVSRFRISKNYVGKNHSSGHCHFMNGTGRSSVALASFPGSGNTWVRGLLEMVTGVCTGSIYCDNSLRDGGMNGEGVRSGAVSVVKTHKRIAVSWTMEDQPSMADHDTNKKNPAYGAAVLIVRNPFHALVAEWSRLVSTSDGHTSQVPREAFGNNSKWNAFIAAKLPAWKEYFRYWVVGGTNNRVMVVRYEDLKSDVTGTVQTLLEFLKFPVNHQQLNNILSQDLNTFKRQHKEDFEHFTESQRVMIRDTITKTVNYLKESNNGNIYDIDDYLQ